MYLEELVACEEVGGGLQDGGHGFSQLLVCCSHGGGGELFSLEHELTRTRSEKMLSISQNKQAKRETPRDMLLYLYVGPQVVLQTLLMALGHNVNHDSKGKKLDY